jgi:hypothetical protein
VLGRELQDLRGELLGCSRLAVGAPPLLCGERRAVAGHSLARLGRRRVATRALGVAQRLGGGDRAHHQTEREREQRENAGARQGAVPADPLSELGQAAGLVGRHHAVLEVGAQVLGHRERVAVAPLGFARHGLLADGFQLGRQIGAQRAQRARRATQQHGQDGVVREPRPWRDVRHLPCEQVVEHGATE